MGNELAGRVALVSGASRGIGEALTRRFAAEGAHVAAVARTVDRSDRMPGSLSETVHSVRVAGGMATAFQADLTEVGAGRKLVYDVEARVGPIDILINNAAVTWLRAVEAFQDKHYDIMFAVQVRAPYDLARAVLPGMRERGRGWILNVSSLAAGHPSLPYSDSDRLGMTVYGMCKAALQRFTSGLAAEVYDAGVSVNSLAPAGVVATWGTIHHHLVPEDDPEGVEYPEEFAEAALALCTARLGEVSGAPETTRDVLRRTGRSVRALDGISDFVRPEYSGSL